MKGINYKALMFECGVYKSSINFGCSASVGVWWLDIHFSFIFFYVNIGIDKRNIELNKIEKECEERFDAFRLEDDSNHYD